MITNFLNQIQRSKYNSLYYAETVFTASGEKVKRQEPQKDTEDDGRPVEPNIEDEDENDREEGDGKNEGGRI